MDLPSEERIRWLLDAMARLHAGGAEPVSGLVLPNGEFFPDTFDRTPRAVERLMRRVLRHAGLSDVAATLGVVAPSADAAERESAGGGCQSGGCATPPRAAMRRVERSDDGYRVNVAAGELSHPTVLTTALCRAAALVFLDEAELARAVAPLDAAADVAAVLLGFGVLLCNGSHLLVKGCGGVRVHSATHLPIELCALGLAIHCRLFSTPPKRARAELDPTARAAFAAACGWVDANRATVDFVRDDPELVRDGRYTLRAPGGLLSRLFRGRGDDELPSAIEPPARERPVDPQRAARLAALRELVDESLDG